MSARKLVGVLLLLLALPAAADAAPVSYTLGGTAGTNGWFRSDVTIRWTVDPVGLESAPSCPPAELITAEGTTTRQCVAYYTGGVTVTSPVVTIRIDKTAPTGVGGALTRAPDANGWFNHPVTASFGGQDAVSGIAGCSQPSYAGVDSASASLAGTCTDVAGNTSGAAAVSFKYDATPPAVTPAPERKPDRGGWYRKPVLVGFTGTDVTSGIASCSAPARYAGPDRPEAAVVGSCRDVAGNVAEGGFAFKYDSTPPKLTAAKAEIANRRARVTWKRTADVARIEIFRTPGVNGRKRTSVYKGNGTVFTDRTVKAGVRYRYEITVADVAGNLARKTVAALQRKPLYSPASGTVVRGKTVVLRWQAVPGTRFYNVQLFRNGVKVMSVWPKGTSLKLRASWTYEGKRQRLDPGRYRWYVWPARGTRVRPQYGQPLGTSLFVVKRS